MKPVILYSFLISIMMGLAPQARADTVDNFQVYLRNEIVLTESSYLPHISTIKFLELGPADINDTIFINYNHCTSPTTGRKIVIWNGEEMLFSRSFPDKETEPLMALPIKAITGLYNHAALMMFYYDDQLSSDGVLLAYIQVDQPPRPRQTNASANRKRTGESVLEWTVAAGMILVMLLLIYRKLTRPASRNERRR